eukprot:gnl/TRDRNA2_/TRDRNA2_173615_c0_seq2.p1 gnl/TRDRNA2_/TRDRNA2_173615_c0~~gnl/TRDRNA2_/TRDRNA2_173615_c0_seq2.p1  ORF type:complete len:530 (-),score=58.75 gnl/TRDRNA2_/TRDRNA2_173615_c0_seq2:143-1576(-)
MVGYGNTCGATPPGLLVGVGARHLVPIFWSEKVPQAAAQKVIDMHEAEVRRLRSVKSAEERCKNVCRGFPPDTTVRVKNCTLFEEACVVSFCRRSQTYRLRRHPNGLIFQSTGNAFHVPVTDVRPNLWREEDPDEAADKLQAAHEEEMRRLALVEELEPTVAGCTLDLQPGTLVRLAGPAEPVPAPGAVPSWSVWKILPSMRQRTSLQGMAKGDIAYVQKYLSSEGRYLLGVGKLPDDDNGETTMARVANSMPNQAYVATADVRPVLRGVADPRAEVESLLKRHASEERRLSLVKQVKESFKREVPAPLNLPLGTEVAVNGSIGQVMAFDSSSLEYVVRVRQAIENVEAAHLWPTFASEDPQALAETLMDMHRKEHERLDLVRRANFISKDWHHGLPADQEVCLDGNPCKRARLLRTVEEGDQVRYAVLLKASDARSLSYTSHIEVPRETVAPVFWSSREPLADVQQLGVRLGVLSA